MHRSILLLLAPLLLTSCALRTSDARGRVTTIGLVWTTNDAPVPAHTEPDRTRVVFGPERIPDPPRWIELRAAGIIFENTPHDFGLTLGYKDSIWVFPVTRGLTEAESGSADSTPARVVVAPIDPKSIATPP